jgi:DNA-directed RNA polymerase specialized sigma24 family protein
MARTGPATLDDLLKQMKTTNRLLLAQLRPHMTQTELVGLLAVSGLTGREVGELLGTSAAAVGVMLQRFRARGKARRNDR